MSAIVPSVAITPQIVGSSIPEKPKPDHKGFSFGDFVDIINPLQHLPVIGTIYRRLTGDQMGPTAEIAGGALFGGLIGAVSSIADVLWTQATGKDFGNTVISWLGFDKKASPVQVAKTATDPAVLAKPTPVAADFDSGLPVLIESMEKQGVDPTIALRAAAAYRNAIGLKNLSIPDLAPAY